MDQYPPGEYVSRAKQALPAAGPDQPLRTVEIDAGSLWGVYRITFRARQNPRQGMRNWFWAMERGERIEFVKPAPSGGVVDFVVSHESDAGTAAAAAILSDGPKPLAESALKITDLIAALERIKAEYGDLTVAEEKPLGFFAIQYVETTQVPKHRSVLGVTDGERVVLIRAQ